MRTLVLAVALMAPTIASAATPAAFDCSQLDNAGVRDACLMGRAKVAGRQSREASWTALCRTRGDLRVGLDLDGFRKTCWGTLKPRAVNVTVTAGHRLEQWVFGNNSFVYWMDGIVTSYQQFGR